MDKPEERVLGVDATATVTALARLDANGNGSVEGSDPGVPGVSIRLRLAGTTSTVEGDPTDSAGIQVVADVPVGTWMVEVSPDGIGDSIQIVSVSQTQLVLGADHEAEVTVLLGYPQVTIEEARATPAGRRVFIEGTVLNARTHFGDNTIHVRDATWAVRTTRPGAVALAVGDSVRVLGTRSVMDGQPTLDQVTIFPLGPGSVPVPHMASTAGAAGAQAGAWDAALVRVTSAVVLEQTTTPGGFQLIVSDGSAPLVVRLDAVASFPMQNFAPGAVLDVRGLLVPTATPGEWAIRPRIAADVIVIPSP